MHDDRHMLFICFLGGALFRRLAWAGSRELLGRAGGNEGTPDIGNAYGLPLFWPGLFLLRDAVGSAVACMMSRYRSAIMPGFGSPSIACDGGTLLRVSRTRSPRDGASAVSSITL